MKNEIKETQGQVKIRQYIGDVFRNEEFVEKIHKIKVLLSSKKEEGAYDESEKFWAKLSEKYEEIYRMEGGKIAKLPKSKINKLLEELVEEYGIDPDLIRDLSVSLILERGENIGDTFDMCMIEDRYDEYFNEEYSYVPIVFDTDKQNRIKVYPVSIDIHRFATKRDVLDFIEKRWDFIEDYLSDYRNKKVRIRRRKISRDLSDFIWENRDLNVHQIKKVLAEKFPQNGLAYYEINKIISLEKKRRLMKINVGQ